MAAISNKGNEARGCAADFCSAGRNWRLSSAYPKELANTSLPPGLPANAGTPSSSLLFAAGGDCIRGGPGIDRVRAGGGDDTVRVRRHGHDRVRCGPGDSTVYAGRADKVRKDCETVHRGR